LQETVWLFANIVNNENVTVQEEFVDLDLMDRKGIPESTLLFVFSMLNRQIKLNERNFKTSVPILDNVVNNSGYMLMK
jgi:hypothetical protein